VILSSPHNSGGDSDNLEDPFNRSFNNPNVNTTDVADGSISGAAPGRNLQFGLKLTF
jgi:hypothetical protein